MGFTPTCVGITLCLELLQRDLTVHPHVRGDHVRTGTNAIAYPGSPPRAWGSLDHARNIVAAQRFTPTCVGITDR